MAFNKAEAGFIMQSTSEIQYPFYTSYPGGLVLTSFFPHFCSPEPHILLFRRSLGTDPTTGMINPRLQKEAVDKYYKDMGIPNPNNGMGITAN